MVRIRGESPNFIRIMLLLALWIWPAASAAAEERIALSEPEWAAGAVAQGRIVRKKIGVANRGGGELKLEIVPDAQRLSAEPAELRLAPGENASIELFFDGNGKAGEFSHRLVFRDRDGGSPELALPVTGTIEAPSKVAALDFFYYAATSCHECREFLEITVPDLEEKLGVSLTVFHRDVLTPSRLGELRRKAKLLGVRLIDLPALIVGDKVLQGKKQIDGELERVLAAYAAGQGAGIVVAPDAGVQEGGADDAVAVIPVILAGLLDGVNPCVFSTLIFLLAYLAYVGRTKKQILVIGIVYSLTVFTTYYLIGLGFFKVIQAASAFPVVALVIQIVLWAVLVLFGALSVHDFIKIRQGKVKEVKLQLPDRFKNRIHKTIRAQAASVTVVASTIAVAFTVTLFELACTGQIYLPTITALVQTRRDVSDFVYLGIYNLAFVAPLVLVFFLAYRGMTSQKLTAFFQKHLALVKILTAGLFFGLAALVAVLNAPLLVSALSKL